MVQANSHRGSTIVQKLRYFSFGQNLSTREMYDGSGKTLVTMDYILSIKDINKYLPNIHLNTYMCY